MSPEQAQGHGVTFASDIFQLGTIMYEMMAGICPCMVGVAEPTPQVVVALQISKLPPRLKALVPSVPDYVDRLIWRSLAKHAQQRYPTMREFTAAIGSALARVVAELPPRERVIRRLQAADAAGNPVGAKSTPIALIASRPATGSRGDLLRTAPLGPEPAVSTPSSAPKLQIAPAFYQDLPLAADLILSDFSNTASTSAVKAAAKADVPFVRRMLVGAVLAGAAVAVPAGVALKIFWRPPAPAIASAPAAELPMATPSLRPTAAVASAVPSASAAPSIAPPISASSTPALAPAPEHVAPAPAPSRAAQRSPVSPPPAAKAPAKTPVASASQAPAKRSWLDSAPLLPPPDEAFPRSAQKPAASSATAPKKPPKLIF